MYPDRSIADTGSVRPQAAHRTIRLGDGGPDLADMGLIGWVGQDLCGRVRRWAARPNPHLAADYDDAPPPPPSD